MGHPSTSRLVLICSFLPQFAEGELFARDDNVVKQFTAVREDPPLA
jgi:hypothetical protein